MNFKSTVPGFIYTIYRFAVEKQLNIMGLFIISSLFITTAVNLCFSRKYALESGLFGIKFRCNLSVIKSPWHFTLLLIGLPYKGMSEKVVELYL